MKANRPLQVGDLVEIVMAGPFPQALGAHCTLTQLLPIPSPLGRCFLTDLRGPGCNIPGCTGPHFFAGPEPCFKLIYDGDDKTGWENSVWKPTDTKVTEPA